MLKADHKYCVLALHAPIELSEGTAEIMDGFWVTNSLPVELEEHWKKWLGTILWREVRKCRAFIVVQAPSASVGLVNKENLRVQNRVKESAKLLFYAFVLHGYRGSGRRVFWLVGDSVPAVRSVGWVNFCPSGVSKNRLDAASVPAVVATYRGLRGVYDAPCRYQRLERRLYAWSLAVESRRLDTRLHQYVRSLEAILKPPVGKSTKGFAHRLQDFVGASKQNHELATKLYELRSCCEHLNDPVPQGAGDGADSETADAIWQAKCFEAEVTASEFYGRLLSRSDLLSLFKDDDSIDAFWKLPDVDRRAVLGDPIDLDSLRAQFSRVSQAREFDDEVPMTKFR